MSTTLITLLILFLASLLNASNSINKLDITGVIAAVATPFNSQLQLDLSMVYKQAEFLNKTNVKGALLTMGSGEMDSVSFQERQLLFTEWMNVTNKYFNNIIVIPHVGMDNIDDSRKLAEFVSTLPNIKAFSSYAPPITMNVESLIQTISYIAEGAPNLPFYFYHTDDDPCHGLLPVYDFIQLAETRIPNLVGMKYEVQKYEDVAKLVAYKNGKYEIWGGHDEACMQFLAAGVKGFAGSEYNYAGELYNKIQSYWNQGLMSDARELMIDAINLKVIEYNITQGSFGVKYMVNIAGQSMGLNVGDARLPYIPMSQSDKNKMQQNVKIWCNQTDNILFWCQDV